MLRMTIRRCIKNGLDVLLYETPNSLKFQMLLICTTEGSNVHDHVTRSTCAEGAQLRQFIMVARYGHWDRLEVRGFTLSYGRGNCPRSS